MKVGTASLFALLLLMATVAPAETDEDADETADDDTEEAEAEDEAPDLEAVFANKTLFGYIETVQLEPGSIRADARIDTGASRSSLHAEDIETFDHSGDTWVRFRFRASEDDSSHGFERPVVEEITIIQASGDETRYVIRLGLCVGDRFAETDFTLTDRGELTYPVLVGRSFLADTAVVSSQREYTRDPNCTTNGDD
ncbi:hypothetical protein J2T57_000338 [Natronocella acetinitrilica]|uniref:Retropepsin-like aspartic endopeptidase domain-containing protein n=1 Tax=Natronocella acetinitrilica TaxID=414046 RepID=A0AAE3G0G7_9GAMM|nr:RimK/LysX family protein [Natronocella acetinitrilica]MCP1673246.1 hypothetical protein [Natronocella acetinitrilica]